MDILMIPGLLLYNFNPDITFVLFHKPFTCIQTQYLYFGAFKSALAEGK